jgi:hypothetical protein
MGAAGRTISPSRMALAGDLLADGLRERVECPEGIPVEICWVVPCTCFANI